MFTGGAAYNRYEAFTFMKTKNRCKKFKRTLFTSLMIFDVLIVVVYSNASRFLLEKGKSELTAYVSNAVYSSLAETGDEQTFAALCSVQTDDNGKIVLIKTDGYSVNVCGYKLAAKTYENLSDYAARGVEIPVGAFTGLTVFSDMGRSVKVPVMNVVGVKCRFLSRLKEAGINLVRHELYLVVETRIKLITRFKSESVSENVEILLFDNLIAAKVPENYIGDMIFGSATAGLAS